MASHVRPGCSSLAGEAVGAAHHGTHHMCGCCVGHRRFKHHRPVRRHVHQQAAAGIIRLAGRQQQLPVRSGLLRHMSCCHFHCLCPSAHVPALRVLRRRRQWQVVPMATTTTLLTALPGPPPSALFCFVILGGGCCSHPRPPPAAVGTGLSGVTAWRRKLLRRGAAARPRHAVITRSHHTQPSHAAIISHQLRQWTD